MSGLPERRLGATGLPVTRLGLGLAAVGRPGYINLGRADDLPAGRSPAALEARAGELLDAACDAGLRYLDVARSYGRAEEFLARWLAARGVVPGALTVGSKWGYRYTADWKVEAAVHEEKELSLARFTTQLAESRALLGPHLALWQIHSATLESGVLDDGAVLAALVAGRREGAYRAIGITVSGPRSRDTLERALAVRTGGERVFDVVQATFNVLDPSTGDALRAAHEAGVGVVVKEAVANGRLTPANRRPDDAHLRDALARLAERTGATVDRLALAWVLAHPFVDVVLSGAATVAQLGSHRDAVGLALDPATRTALDALRETPDRYWRTRGRLAWS
jgi:aryl-alcohol dehydrogenase-like predicted oxidoreductase